MKEYLIDNLFKVSELFKEYGIRSQSMDDIAATLDVSKKTLYKYLGNKDNVVKLVIDTESQAKIKQAQNQLKRYYSELTNPIELIVDMIRRSIKDDTRRAKFYIPDLQKYYPQLMSRLLENFKIYIDEVFPDFVKMGIETDYFRNDLDYENIALLMLSNGSLIDNHLIPLERVKEESFINTFMIFNFSSILTEKGRNKLEQIIN